MIYLASTSPRRKMLLKKAGINFRALRPSYDEDNGLKGKPSFIVQTHALKKAESCIQQIQNGIVLGSDTLVYFKGHIIGKPENMKKAFRVLAQLQNQWHVVYTGVAFIKVEKRKITQENIFFEKTRVKLKKLSLEEIKNYFKKVNPLDKAGAYAIQSSHGGIVEEVKGFFSNAVGLPVERIQKLMEKKVN